MATQNNITNNLKSNFQRLRRYFSGKTVVIPKSDGKLKLKTVEPVERAYDSLWTARNSSMTNSFINNYASRSQNRMYLNYEYDLMEKDPIISRSLTLVSQEVCLKNQQDEILQINTDNENIKISLEHLFYEVMNIDALLQSWTRLMLKYGDCFLYLHLQEGVGITDIVQLGSADTIREENDETGETTFSIGGMGDKLNEEHIAHFRNAVSVEFFPYGVSILEPVRKYWKMQMLLEDFMMVYYLLRSVNQRVFRVDVGALDPNKVPDFIEKFRQLYKKKPLVNQETGDYDIYYDPLSYIEDIILPVREGYDNTEFDEIPQSPETNIIDGIELLRQKIMAGLGIPNFLMNYEEQINSRSTASAEDIRFGKLVENVQSKIVSELEKIAVTHLILQGYSKKDILSVSLSLTPPSNLHQMEKFELLERKIDIANKLKESTFFSKEHIWKEIFEMSDDEILDMKQQMQQDLIDEQIDEDVVSNINIDMGDEDEDVEIGDDDSKTEENPQGGLPEGEKRPDQQSRSGRVEDLLSDRGSGSAERRISKTDDLER